MRVSVLVACTLLAANDADAVTLTPFSSASGAELPAPWRVTAVPTVERQTKYSVVRIDGRVAVKAQADASNANLLHPVQADIGATPILRFSWRVDRLPPNSNLTSKDGDDAAAKVCVLFDLPLDRLSFADRMQMQVARRLFDPQLPTATLCYVWDRTLPRETWLSNAYTNRVRMLVLRSAAAGDRGAWLSEQRDLRADFVRAFGTEAAGAMPPVVAIAFASDADNTGSSALSYLADITLAAE
ncbi:MAG: DUF3047 domain-containing protein [Burkholderiaceae bacterium]